MLAEELLGISSGTGPYKDLFYATNETMNFGMTGWQVLVLTIRRMNESQQEYCTPLCNQSFFWLHPMFFGGPEQPKTWALRVALRKQSNRLN